MSNAPHAMRAFAATLACAALTAQADWMQVAGGPGARWDSGFCAAPGGGLLLFGGGSVLTFAPYGDTWLLGASGWLAAQPSASPGPRAGHRLAFDSLRNRAVLFGGYYQYALGGWLNDTWEWDGANWLQRATPTAPSPRVGVALAFDSGRGRTVLFGGSFNYFPAALYADTWEWDGTVWRAVATANAPSGRSNSAMVYDGDRARILLFGGTDGALRADTWEFDGVDWRLRTPAHSPTPRVEHALAADGARGRVVLFGGTDGTNDAGDTWEWDGLDWQQRAPGTSPSPRYGAALAFDPVRGRCVLFGGAVGNLGVNILGDAFEYFTPSPASVATIAPGCAGSLGVPALAANGAPWLGDTIALRASPAPANAPALLAVGLSNATWGALPLPLSLAPLGMPGCALAVSGDASVPMPPAGGVPTCVLALPLQNAFAGLRLFAQPLIADAAANTAGLVLGDAIALRLGLR